MADYDRDGFLDVYLCVYSYFFGAGEDKAGTPMPYYDARNGPPGVLFRNDGHGRFVDATEDAGLDAGNDRYHFAAAWADYDEDGWPDLLVANDFGTKNLYRNLGRAGRHGHASRTSRRTAGVLDHGAGMSATFLDYDNDGRLDIYTGNMWSAPGQRVTSSPAFMPDATPEVRALYRRHVRGNSLLRNLGNGRFEDRSIEARADDGPLGLVVRRARLRQRRLGRSLRRQRHADARRGDRTDLEGFFWRQVVAQSPLTRCQGHAVRRGVAGDQPVADPRVDRQPSAQRVPAQRRTRRLRRGLGRARARPRSGRPIVRACSTSIATAIRTSSSWRRGRRRSCASSATTSQSRGRASLAVRLTGTKSNRDAIGARVTVETDRMRRTKIVQAGSGFLSQHSKELLVRARRERAHRRS